MNNIFIEKIKNASEKLNLNAYIVGGPVRDMILKKEVKDYDFLIEGSAIDFAKNAGFKIKSIHESFNTVKIDIDNNEIDIASTREEKYPENGCLPVVDKIGVNIEKDLKRRDFTVNAIAYNLRTNEFIDPYSGIKDIKEKKLKILHDKSFLDDPTRILRGLDFKYRFNFEFSKETFNLALKCKDNYDRKGLSIDRIYLTLNKIFQNDNADKILSDILNFEFYKIWTDKIEIQEHDIKKLEEAIKLFNAEKNRLYIMALESIDYPKVKFNDLFEVYQFFKSFKLNQLAFYYFKTQDNNVLKYLKIKDTKTFLNGNDLINEGFKQGEIIGKILKSILKEKIIHPEKLKTKEDEINFIKDNFKLT